MVVRSGKKFNLSLSEGEVPPRYTIYGMSDSGWMDQELFSYWFSNQFLQHAVAARLLLLLLDGHSSHFTLDLINFALRSNYVPSTTHYTADSQPLDMSFLVPLKPIGLTNIVLLWLPILAGLLLP